MIIHPPAKRRSARLGVMAMAIALAGSAGAALAQDASAPPPSDDSEIVVSGTAEDINRARNYIQALQVTALNVQAARWADPICVGVTGTSPAIAERLAGRINAAASQIGAKRGEAGCKPNLLVIFAKDASDYMAQMRRTSAARLQEIPKRREAFTFGKTAPIRWWYNTDVMGSDGRPLNAGATGLVACGGPCALPSLNANVRSQNTYSSSIVRAPTVRHIKSAVVVIDVPLAAGRSVDSLGDYAALVSLAEIWPDNSAVPTGSILGLFTTPPQGAGEGPLLGTMDRRFLCELYRMPLDRSGQYHKGTLTRAVSAAQDRCFDREEPAAGG
ncbi:MAG: hypothetical protein ACJLS3_09950 [Erythrobacter sp.]